MVTPFSDRCISVTFIKNVVLTKNFGQKCLGQKCLCTNHDCFDLLVRNAAVRKAGNLIKLLA